jgi:hypothetical protein
MIPKTIQMLAAGALLATSLPVLADHRRGDDDDYWERGGYRQGRVVEYRYPVREIVVERPVYVERRVVVERPVYVDRPVYVESAAPVYEPPVYGRPVYGHPGYEPQPAHGPFPPGIGRKVAGTTAGAVAGAAIGSTIGRGDGRSAAMAVGAVLGGMLGSQF